MRVPLPSQRCRRVPPPLPADRSTPGARARPLRARTPSNGGVSDGQIETRVGAERYLFQDVYLWAGELRTVGIEKENESFMTPGDIGRPVAYIAAQIAQTKQLRSISNADLPGRLEEMYDFVNSAHPFREGNGRTRREFFDQLLSESGRGLAWDAIELTELHHACHLARPEQTIEPLRPMFAKIVDDDPAYRFGRDIS